MSLMRMDRTKPTQDDGLTRSIAAANQYFPEAARRQMAGLIEQKALTDQHLAKIMSTAQTLPRKVGFAAEELHAESFNFDALLKEKTTRALTDKYESWNATGMRGNDQIVDIGVVDTKDDSLRHAAQVKYYGTAKKTEAAMRQVDQSTGQHKYKDADSLIGPSDQINPANGKQSITDHAQKTSARNADVRPQVSDAAKNVEERATDRLHHDGVESNSATRKEVKQVLKDAGDGAEKRREQFAAAQRTSTLHQVTRAAGYGAACGALMGGILSTVRCCQLVHKGKITEEQAVIEVLKITAVTGADSALKAAAATGAVSVATQVAPEVLARSTMTGLLARTGTAGAAVCSVDLVVCIVKMASGKMTARQVEDRFGKNIMQTAGAASGSAIGISMVGSGGLVVGGVALAPLIAAFSGGLIGGVAMTVAIDRGIEGPFREMTENTCLLAEAQAVMRDTADRFAHSQEAFQMFLREERRANEEFERASGRIDHAGRQLTKAIDRI